MRTGSGVSFSASDLPVVPTFDRALLLDELSADLRSRLAHLTVLAQTGSTNQDLLAAPPPPPGAYAVQIADFQRAGRGRRGRRWLAPPGAALCLSAAWQWPHPPASIAVLPLAIGIAARSAIASLTGTAVSLKWPNDLYWRSGKLAGVLVERGSLRRTAHIVAGVGINVAWPAGDAAPATSRPAGATDLAAITGGAPPARERLAAALLEQIDRVVTQLRTHGAAPLVEQWRAADMLHGRRIRIEDASGVFDGLARGIDSDGALLIECGADGLRRILSGDVSVRPADVDTDVSTAVERRWIS